MTTTEVKTGEKLPAITVKGWKYTQEWFPAGQHTRGSYPGQRADVLARHTGLFELDLDLYKDGATEQWEASTIRKWVGDRLPYIRRGTEGSLKYLIAVTSEIASWWWPFASGLGWGEIRSAGFVPSPGSLHESGQTYDAVPGPDEIRYPDGQVIWGNALWLDQAGIQMLTQDGARNRLAADMAEGREDLPDDIGRCPLVYAYLEKRPPEFFDGADPRGDRANKAANYLKQMDADGHLIGGWIEEVLDRLPNTSTDDFEDMWSRAPVKAGTVAVPRGCCSGRIMPVAQVAQLNGSAIIPELSFNVASDGTHTPAPWSPDDQLALTATQYPAVDWAAAWKAQPEDINWLYRQWLEAGTINALFAAQGTGKSLLAQEVSWSLACDGHSVVYIDEENRVTDWVERLKDMGAEPGDLANLHLYSFAALPALDTPAGGWALLSLAVRDKAELVVLDTTMRMVNGEENQSDTFLKLYRNSLTALKARGVTVLRLDHPGKDTSKGQRGTSAKGDAEDSVWLLTEVAPEASYRMERTKTRNGHGPPGYTISRLKSPLRHAWSLNELSAVTELSKAIADSGLPLDAGRPAVRAALAEKGIKASNAQVSQAIRARKALSRTAADSSDSRAALADCPSSPPYRGGQADSTVRDTFSQGGPAGIQPSPPPISMSPERLALLAKLGYPMEEKS